MLSSLLNNSDAVASQLAAISLNRGKEEKYPDEPLLKENTKRFVLFPIQWNDLWDAYKDSEAKFWGAEEIKLTIDADDWASSTLSPSYKSLILRSLTLLASEPALYGEDLTEKLIQGFSEAVQTLEARCMYGYMMFGRNIYRELFSLCLEVFGGGFDTRKEVFESIRDGVPALAETTAWLKSYALDTTLPFAERNIALAAWHHIHNSLATAALFHLFPTTAAQPSTPSMNTPKKSAGHAKKPIALPGLVHGLQKINGDFTRYMNYDALINNHLNRHAPTEFAHECVKKAVECEVATWSAILEMGEPATVNGTPIPSADVFAKHAESKADELLQAFGYPALYKTDSPFPWLSSVAYEMDGDQTVLATPLHKSVPRPVMMPMMSPSPAPGGKKKQQEAADMFTFDADF